MRALLQTLLIVAAVLALTGVMLLTIWLAPVLALIFWFLWWLIDRAGLRRHELPAHGHAYERED